MTRIGRDPRAAPRILWDVSPTSEDAVIDRMHPLLRAAACVAALAAFPLALAAQRPATPLTQEQLVGRVQALLDSLSAADEFSGVILLARGAQPVFQRAYGMADREARRANDLETRFNLGSINKVFTATVVRQLAAEGRLSLDDTLGRLLPEYPNRDAAARVTIRQLLEHRSGIFGNIFAAPPGGTRHEVRSTRDFLALVASEPLQFEPGSRQQYSNAGYVVLGAVIERVTGTSYYDAVRERVFRPAGMNASDSYAVDSLPANTALGYTRGFTGAPGGPPSGPWRRNTETLPGRGSSAGGGYSTAGDLLRFVVASYAGLIRGAPRGLGAAGGAPGINGIVEEDLPGGYHLIVLTNLDPPAAERVARTVRGWLGAED